MFEHIRPAIASLALMTLVTGAAYPLTVTAVAQLAMADAANGSLLRDGSGQVRGSALLAQSFQGAEWFLPRPSAADYATVASGASNLAPSNPELLEQVRQRIQAWNGGTGQPVPMELVTTSASGLDPHLTLAAARYQIARVAQARGMPAESLERLLQAHLSSPTVGPAVVNVLALNLALADNRSPDSSE
ncbi:MAG: potassium-transporting ATPase subunit KdpC [Pseudomonas stutzeri]|uniref:potassium-transporting ATPase subunit KdpC n=1 Tax=Stutzerimonas stutzeri TaxID=316 RepID=UPI000838073E|nr:potassium-transporting ATPase subunit KdpC [Stutzerimonas stutzeri]MDH0119522.1 potassium-transporting ATPase subunit KdpC [Stutzerimonas stutzeri]MTI90685.1 potassium-transporting ATPase subunit KdpC [Stutzerimonas stutzeri]OCX55167.1 potassium-transporting ATPase subunit C [Stutzerimonas stutzeri]